MNLSPLIPALVIAAHAIPVTAAAQAASCDPASNPYCEQVQQLIEDAAVQDALEFIEETDDRAMTDLVTLTEIPAPPFNEDARAMAYADMLREAGADSVWIDEQGNVLALREGTSGENTVLIEGHLDTVFPEGTDVTVEMRGDTLYAPGVGDDTRGLVVVLQALRALEAAEIATEADLLFVGTVGEEGLGDLSGVKYLFRDGGPDIDAYIAVDGGDEERMVVEGIGSHRFRVTFEGPGGHSWGAFGTANPAHALGRAIYLFEEAADVYTRSGARTSYNIGRIGGGTSINSVPFEAWMEVDMRSEEDANLNAIDSIFRAAVQQALVEENEIRRRGEPLTVDVEMVGNRPSGRLPMDSPLVQRASAVISEFGGTPEYDSSSTNANIPFSLGVPAVTIGRGGSGGNGHAPDEWWVNENGAAAIQQALLLLVAQAGLAS